MSEEAERKLRSEGTIGLEPGDPSRKRSAAVEGGGSSKSIHTLGSSSRTVFKGKHSSPLSFKPDQPSDSSSPLGGLNISKSIDDALPLQMIGKPDGNAGYEKGVPAMTFNAMRHTPSGKGNDIAKPIDLQRLLISLLRNRPHGLTLKALEKAIQAVVPNPLEKIKPILRNIARYKSDGRYVLLPGVDFRKLNKPQAEIGSSSNGNNSQKAAHHTVEKINVQHALPYIFGGEKDSDHSEWLGRSSSDDESGSDSESDGGDSGSDTGSHSSGSATTGSEGISDSGSDASLNNKEGSDEDLPEELGDEKALTTATFSSKGGQAAENMPFLSGYDSECQNYIRSLLPERAAILSEDKNLYDIYEHIMRLKDETLGQAQGYPGMDARVLESTCSFNIIGHESSDESPVVNRRGICLEKDPSDLKSGEVVKSTPVETHLARQLQIKEAENRANTSGKGKLKALDAETECHNKLSEMNYGYGANKFGVGQYIALEGCSESSMRAQANATPKQHGTEGGTASYPVEERKQTTDSLEAVADRGKGPRIANENNDDQKGEFSPDDDSLRYLKYEKDEPEFKGPITTMAQYQEYVLEYNEKYPDFVALRQNLKDFESNFEQLAKNLKKAKNNRDGDRFREILGQIKETYELHVAHHKRLKMIFIVLCKELVHLRQMITDFVDAQNEKTDHLKQMIRDFLDAQNKKNAQN